MRLFMMLFLMTYTICYSVTLTLDINPYLQQWVSPNSEMEESSGVKGLISLNRTLTQLHVFICIQRNGMSFNGHLVPLP